MKQDFQALRTFARDLLPEDFQRIQVGEIIALLEAYDLRGLQIENISRAYEARGDGLYRRVVELEAKELALHAQLASGQEPVQIPAEVVKYAKAMRSDGYRGPLSWASKIIDFVAEYTHPAPAQQPLSEDQVSQIVQWAGYDAASPQERADFINGIRHKEAAHGIK